MRVSFMKGTILYEQATIVGTGPCLHRHLLHPYRHLVPVVTAWPHARPPLTTRSQTERNPSMIALLPWFIVATLSGVIIGLLVGILTASVLVKGHYTHFLANSPKTQAPLSRVVYTHPREYDPRHDEGGYYN